jgi:hypothetical protein
LVNTNQKLENYALIKNTFITKTFEKNFIQNLFNSGMINMNDLKKDLRYE